MNEPIRTLSQNSAMWPALEAFRATFGTDDDLLKLQDELISAWMGSVV